jgi:cobalamin biosynthetic protein CobC
MSHSHAHEAPDVLTEHGGNLAAARRRFPSAPLPWIDLSTGINQAPYPVGSLTSELWERLPEADAIEKLEAQENVGRTLAQPLKP